MRGVGRGLEIERSCCEILRECVVRDVAISRVKFLPKPTPSVRLVARAGLHPQPAWPAWRSSPATHSSHYKPGLRSASDSLDLHTPQRLEWCFISLMIPLKDLLENDFQPREITAPPHRPEPVVNYNLYLLSRPRPCLTLTKNISTLKI